MGFEPKTGYNMKLYRNTGTFASPTWVEIAEVGDVNLSDFTRQMAELKRRGKQFTKNLASLINSIVITFKLPFGLGASTYTYLRTAFLAGTAFEVAIMSGDITTPGEEGLRCPILLEQFPWNQALEEASGHDVQLKIAYMVSGGSEVDPVWLVIT